jgi:predicted nucleic acid-binding protein
MIFADSGYFIGLWDPNDQHRSKALLIERKLREVGLVRGLNDLVTCMPMACEVAEHLTFQRGPVEGAAALAQLLNNCIVVRPTERDIQAGFDRTFRVYSGLRNKKKRPGLVDSIGVAIMERIKVYRIVTFDQGFDLVPGIRRLSGTWTAGLISPRESCSQ